MDHCRVTLLMEWSQQTLYHQGTTAGFDLDFLSVGMQRTLFGWLADAYKVEG